VSAGEGSIDVLDAAGGAGDAALDAITLGAETDPAASAILDGLAMRSALATGAGFPFASGVRDGGAGAMGAPPFGAAASTAP
jgi:hypothetical protein